MIYKCAGANRLDPETDKPLCAHESTKPWRGRCPACGRPFDCKPFGTERSNKRVKVTAASSSAEGVAYKYIPTGVKGVDEASGGGLVKGQALLLAGKPGSRKTSLSLMILQGLAKQTKRPLLYVSAEEDDAAILQLCLLLKVDSPQIEIRGNTGNLEDALVHCEELNPYATVFDSLQGLGGGAANAESVAKEIVRYSKKKGKMISIIISHLTKALDVKGGVGPPHFVDTVAMYEPFVPSLDGDPRILFGRKVATEIGYDDTARNLDELGDLRVFVYGADGKNRMGRANQRAYSWTNPEGELVWLKLRPKLVLAGTDEDD